MKHILSAVAVMMMVCVFANAEEVTFSFRGTIHELDGEFSYFSGHTFEIIYSFERATNDANPDDFESGNYIGAIKSGSLTIFTAAGPLKWVVNPDEPYNVIGVKNLDEADSYFAGASISGPVGGSEIPASFIVELMDREAIALSNDDLPSSLEIRSFDFHHVQFTFIGAKQYIYSTVGVITSGNAPIPHP